MIYAIPLVSGILNEGNIFGITLGAIVYLFGVFYNPILTQIINAIKMPYVRILLLFIFCLIILGGITFLITLIVILTNSKQTANNEDTVITLGCRVKGDLPSLQLQRRCDATIEYLKHNEKAVAILSGGQGPDEDISEAQCMYEIMLKAGICKDRLFIEDKSTSTDENIKFSKRIINENQLSEKVVVITSEYHLMRAKMICAKHGIKAKGIPAKSNLYTLPTFYTREVFGVWVQWLKS